MIKVLGFLLTLATLLHTGDDLNWQGTGNMSKDNTTIVWDYINANFQKSWDTNTVSSSGNTILVNFATGLSDHLNSNWNQAWNVVVAYDYLGVNQDTVLYGYSFRDHWMWYNGIKMNDNYYTGFVLWKDYNCIKWQSFNANAYRSTYPASYPDSSSLKTVIQGLQSSVDKSNPWEAAQTYVNALESSAAVKTALGSSDIAFSVVMSQSNTVQHFGRFCAKDYLSNSDKVGTVGGDWGIALILQMR